MRDELTTESLRSKFSGVSNGLPGGLRLRLHRSLSWIERAEKEAEDIDAAFIFYWIAFNAAYAKDIPESYGAEERELFGEYFEKIVRFDSNRRIYEAIWLRFSGPIRLLLNNKFVFQPFWRHHNQPRRSANWENFFVRDQKMIGRALARQDTRVVLSILFDRLYVLRNQLFHGGATWKSGVNRRQVQDGAQIMAFLVPRFIDLMMDHPEAGWGPPYYPVVD